MKKILKTDLFLSIFAFFIKIAAGGASYLLFVFYSREMGPSEFGVFSLIFSVIMMIALVSNFGQQTFIIKEIPRCTGKDRYSKEKGVYYFSYLSSVIGGVIGSIVFIGYTSFFYDNISITEKIYCCILIILFALSQSTLATLRINNKTMLGVITRDLIWRMLTILIFLYLVFFVISDGNKGIKSVTGIKAFVYGLLPIIAIHILVINNDIFRKLKNTVPSFKIKEWLKVSSGFALIAFISSADVYLYTIIIAEYASTTEVGAVFASLKTVELLNLFLMAVTLIISPKLSEYVANNDFENLQRKCNVAILLQSVPVIIFSTLIFSFSSELLTIFDSSFKSYSTLLNLLAVGMIINALTGATVLLLQLGNMHWRHVLFQGSSVLLSIALLPYFYNNFGIDGIAYSFILSKLMWNILAIHSIKKHLFVDPSIFSFLSKERAYLDKLKSDIFNFK